MATADPEAAAIARPIDLARDAATCIAFRRDAYLASFGSIEGFAEEMGEDNARYLTLLAGRIAAMPEGSCHWWHDREIVGQSELRLLPDAPRTGYVNLFYVVPAWRGRGLGRLLHEHAAQAFRARGLERMRLSVAERNAAAIAFYERLGWTAAGTRPHRVPMRVMEFRLA